LGKKERGGSRWGVKGGGGRAKQSEEEKGVEVFNALKEAPSAKGGWGKAIRPTSFAERKKPGKKTRVGGGGVEVTKSQIIRVTLSKKEKDARRAANRKGTVKHQGK